MAIEISFRLKISFLGGSSFIILQTPRLAQLLAITVFGSFQRRKL